LSKEQQDVVPSVVDTKNGMSPRASSSSIACRSDQTLCTKYYWKLQCHAWK
jgi:hypothetical protein